MQSDPLPPPDVFFGGVSSLAEQLDSVYTFACATMLWRDLHVLPCAESVLIVLRDGKHIVGKLSSYDQYGSLVLEHSSERIFAGGKYADKEMGLYFIRGENVVMLSEIDPSKESGGRSGPALVQGSWEEVGTTATITQPLTRLLACSL